MQPKKQILIGDHLKPRLQLVHSTLQENSQKAVDFKKILSSLDRACQFIAEHRLPVESVLLHSIINQNRTIH